MTTTTLRNRTAFEGERAPESSKTSERRAAANRKYYYYNGTHVLDARSYLSSVFPFIIVLQTTSADGNNSERPATETSQMYFILVSCRVFSVGYSGTPWSDGEDINQRCRLNREKKHRNNNRYSSGEKCDRVMSYFSMIYVWETSAWNGPQEIYNIRYNTEWFFYREPHHRNAYTEIKIERHGLFRSLSVLEIVGDFVKKKKTGVILLPNIRRWNIDNCHDLNYSILLFCYLILDNLLRTYLSIHKTYASSFVHVCLWFFFFYFLYRTLLLKMYVPGQKLSFIVGHTV